MYAYMLLQAEAAAAAAAVAAERARRGLGSWVGAALDASVPEYGFDDNIYRSCVFLD